MKRLMLFVVLLLFPLIVFAGEKVKGTSFFVTDNQNWKTGEKTGYWAFHGKGVANSVEGPLGTVRIECHGAGFWNANGSGSGESVGAQEAQRIGLVNGVVSLKDLMPRCRQLAAGILANGPLAVRYCIEAINSGLDMPLQEATRLEASLFSLCCATQDMKEGTRAFIEKKKPQFKGR